MGSADKEDKAKLLMVSQLFLKCKKIFYFCTKNTKKHHLKQKKILLGNKDILALFIFVALFSTVFFIPYARAQSQVDNTAQSLIAPTLLEPHTKTITNAKPLIAGVSVNDTTVEIYIDDEHIGNSWTANHPSGIGNFYFDVLKSLNPGTHSIKLRAQDVDTLEKSNFSQQIEITIVPFGGPTLLLQNSVTLTKEFTYIDGVAHNNSIIHIIVNEILAETFTIGEDKSGAVGFHYILKNPLHSGINTIYLQAEDESGRLSIPTSMRTIRIVDFPKPTILKPINKTKIVETAPTITGVAFNDSRISIYVDGALDGETSVINNQSGVGHFAYTVSTTLSKTRHAITAVANDKKGRRSAQSNNVEIVVEEFYIPPTLFAIMSRGSQPSISGVAHNDSTIAIFVDGKKNTTFKPNNHSSGTVYFNVKLEHSINYGTHRITATAFDGDNKPSMASNTLWYAYKNPSQIAKTQTPPTEKEPTPPALNKPTPAKIEDVKPSFEGKVATPDENQSKTPAKEESGNKPAEKNTEENRSTSPQSSAGAEATTTNWPLVLGLILLIGLAFLFIIWYLGQKRKLLNEGIDKLFTDEDNQSFEPLTKSSASSYREHSQSPENAEKVQKEPSNLSDDIPPPPPAI